MNAAVSNAFTKSARVTVLLALTLALFGVSAIAQVAGGGGAAGGGAAGGGGGGGGRGGGGFFGSGGPVAFNPEPSAVFTGHSLHIGATVSADRKYVHLNMAPTQTATTGVQNFPIYFAGGFVGTTNAGGLFQDRAVQDPGALASARTSPVIVSTTAPLTGVLGETGMTKIANLH